jgi:hypothetical protein
MAPSLVSFLDGIVSKIFSNPAVDNRHAPYHNSRDCRGNATDGTKPEHIGESLANKFYRLAVSTAGKTFWHSGMFQ